MDGRKKGKNIGGRDGNCRLPRCVTHQFAEVNMRCDTARDTPIARQYRLAAPLVTGDPAISNTHAAATLGKPTPERGGKKKLQSVNKKLIVICDDKENVIIMYSRFR